MSFSILHVCPSFCKSTKIILSIIFVFFLLDCLSFVLKIDKIHTFYNFCVFPPCMYVIQFAKTQKLCFLKTLRLFMFHIPLLFCKLTKIILSIIIVCFHSGWMLCFCKSTKFILSMIFVFHEQNSAIQLLLFSQLQENYSLHFLIPSWFDFFFFVCSIQYLSFV